jgi:peptidoglycan/xylan/chitin deacetylase (PgdA/CDA1 family)
MARVSVQAGNDLHTQPAKPSVLILMYHHLDPYPLPAFEKYTVTPRAFRMQMRWLALAGYTSIGLDALVENRLHGRPLPARPVAITFDDGFQGCADLGGPILREFGFTATFYLVAGLMGRPSRWLRRERGVEFPIMDWDTARALAGQGFGLGAHTLTHPRLAELDTKACREELERSRGILESQLGTAVEHLAYPFGSYDERVRDLTADAGYRTASSVRIGISAAEDDLLALHRIPVNGGESLLDFVCRSRSGRTSREALLRAKRALGRRMRPWRHGG